jgi:hypothetical protein
MTAERKHIVLFALTLFGMAGLMMVSFASETGQSATSVEGRVPVPSIPVAASEFCVEDTDFMRRNHMDLLTHQRDETVQEGVRTKQHSLKECIRCHAVTGPEGIPLTVSSPEHFCRSCHDYAAVKIDCFQCHASRPGTEEMPAGHRMSQEFPTTSITNRVD